MTQLEQSWLLAKTQQHFKLSNFRATFHNRIDNKSKFQVKVLVVTL